MEALAASIRKADEAIQQIAPLMQQLNLMLPAEHRLEPFGAARPE